MSSANEPGTHWVRAEGPAGAGGWPSVSSCRFFALAGGAIPLPLTVIPAELVIVAPFPFIVWGADELRRLLLRHYRAGRQGSPAA